MYTNRSLCLLITLFRPFLLNLLLYIRDYTRLEVLNMRIMAF